MTKEKDIEVSQIVNFHDFEYTFHGGTCEKEVIARSFCPKLEIVNLISLIDPALANMSEGKLRADVCVGVKPLREMNRFSTEGETSVHCTLSDNEDLCKNEFQLVNPVPSNTDTGYLLFVKQTVQQAVKKHDRRMRCLGLRRKHRPDNFGQTFSRRTNVPTN